MNEASSAAPATSSTPTPQVLILEPDENLSAEIASSLEEALPGTNSAFARSVGEAQQLAVAQKPDLFVLDVDSVYDSAQEFIYDLRTSHPNARAIILTATHFTAQREQVAGLGAMHFLEKPFPRADFMTLVEALLAPGSSAEGERFQGTLSDLHIADIIQLKCISGATSMLEFTGPRKGKARVYFENGQVRHATAPGKEGREAFNQIVDWKGGVISEVPVPEGTPRTITLDWQVLLMEAVRHIDEARGTEPEKVPGKEPGKSATHTILVIDDSLMLLSFVKEILSEEHYDVVTAPTAEEGLQACRATAPALILLDYVLPDMKGDEVCRKLMADAVTSKIPVVYMSGFGSDLQPDRTEIPNVIGSLSKPFTSESLINAVQNYLANGACAVKDAKASAMIEKSAKPVEVRSASDSLGKGEDEPLTQPATPSRAEPMSAPPTTRPGPIRAAEQPLSRPSGEPVMAGEATTSKQVAEKSSSTAPPPIPKSETPQPPAAVFQAESVSPDLSNAYFCGDSSFFSLHWALQTIAREKLTGALRAFWSRPSIELLARDGHVVVVTTRDPNLYCEEPPVTILNLETERIDAARNQQTRSGCPLFVTLLKEDLILREPGLQLVQHYGQKLFAQLWTAERVRFVFEQQELPAYTHDLPLTEENIDQWALSTLRFVQYQELETKATVDPAGVPAYTRDGSERVQHLRLTAAEAQFASQFNGSRSIAQISKNLRLDIKFARLTLFRFLALEIVECWPAQLAQRPEARGGFRGIFGR